MKEIWKIYKKTQRTLWEVSNLGNVKKNGVLLEFNNIGYFQRGHYYIHKMVAETFIPNPENKPQVDHIDTNIHNNSVDNLRWTTAKENANNPNTRQHILSYHKNLSTDDRYKKYLYTQTIEFKNKMKEVMSDEDIRKKISLSMIERYKNKEAHILTSITTKLALNKPEIKEKISKNSSCRCWVHKDLEEKFIKKEDYQKYINNGWQPKRNSNTGKKISNTKKEKLKKF